MESGFQVDILLISFKWVDLDSKGVVVLDGVGVVVD
jgi:hypothetical protein